MDKDDFEGFHKFLSEEKHLGKRTIAIYMFYYKDFEPSKLSEDYIREFIIKHKNTSPVRAFVSNYLLYHGIKMKFPEKSTKGDKKKKVIRPILSSEIDTMRKYLYSIGFKEGLIFDLMYQGALRRVEIITIQIGSFRWDEWFENMNKFCKLIVLGKGNKERYVLINPETALSIIEHYMKAYNISYVNEMTAFLHEHKDSLLFIRDDKKPFTEKNIYDLIKKNSIRILKRDIRPQELRHERATELERKGINPRDIKNYLGHSRISTTEIYLHKTGEESLESIENYLNK